jgi:acetyl esterase
MMTYAQQLHSRGPSLLAWALLCLASAVLPASGAQSEEGRAFGRGTYPPVMPEARAETYKTIGPTTLQLYIFAPTNHVAATNRRPAIVFFFGGGWTSGSPQQFEKQCQYLASRGMVAITADYRVASRQQVRPVQCVADAKSAIRWVRQNAARLGVDPNRIVAAGGSAGGHTAACTAVIPGLDEPGEDMSISSAPNAAILFNPALVLAPVKGQDFGKLGDRVNAARMGIEPEQISPIHHVHAGVPPIIVFHGKADNLIPFSTIEAFAARMKAAGNRCEVVGFENQGHGFFNYGRGDNRFFIQTMTEADRFLASLGYVSGPPQVEQFLKSNSN